MIAAGFFLLVSGLARAGELPALDLAEGWHDLFAGQDVELHVASSDDSMAGTRLAWSVDAGGRVLVRREEVLENGRSVACRFTAPEVKEGVVLALEFRAQAVGPDGQPRSAQLTRRLHVFPEDAFPGAAEWLRGLRVVLFDPAGDTANLFSGAGIPFMQVRSLDSVVASEGGWLVVGEGVSLLSNKGLAKRMEELARGGMKVLCLSPADGSFPFPGTVADQPGPGHVKLQRADVIRALDKTLDDDVWQQGGPVHARSLSVVSDRQSVRVNVEQGRDAWAWIDVGYGTGRIIVCMPEIVAKWDASPAPRYLLLAVLQHMEGTDHE